ncbi:MAG: hypothetical protein F7C36_00350 [Desulfurococcales archaeon]|nr:hypothetical protein [Desulfurococcales archaeon]
MKKASSIFLLGLLLLSIILPGVLGLTTRADTTMPLSYVEEAINLGVQAVKTAIRPLGNYMYVMPDHPSPTISVEYNGEIYIPGSFLDPGDLLYKTELVEVTQYSVAWRYYFNVDSDEDYDIIIYARLQNVDPSTDKLTINVDKSEYTITLLVGTRDPYKYTSVNEGFSTTIYITDSNRDKFHSARYVARHSTQLAGWLMYEEKEYGLSQGLLMTMEEVGFWYDVYDPIWGRSNSYPDNYWDYPQKTWLANGYEAHPWDKSETLLNYPYRSRMYILDALPTDYSLEAGIRGWEDAPLYSLLKAIHLLNKYGTSKASEAEQLIAHALWEGRWDGYGLHYAMLDPTWITTGQKLSEFVSYEYKGYPIYLNSVLLIALIRYYEVTGDQYISDQNILYMADRLAGILVNTQWRYEHETPWGLVRLALFKGWWPAAYSIGSYILKPSAWGIIDTITSGWDEVTGYLAKLGIDIGKAFRPMPSEWPFAIVNSESTLLAIKALKVYLDFAQKYGRQPVDVAVARVGGVEFVEVGGGCYPSCGFEPKRYNITIGADDYGRWINATTISAMSGEAWAYSYAKFKFRTDTSGTHQIQVGVTLNYTLLDYYDVRERIFIVIKIIDSTNTVVEQWENLVIELDNETFIVKTLSLYYEYNTTLSPGDYYIEIGLKTQVIGGSFIIIPGKAKAYASIDFIKIEG